MPQAQFFLMPESIQSSAIDDLYLAACQLAEQHYRQQQWVYIHCKDKQQAHAIDELLWQFEPSSFVPHNLKGEGLYTGSPVEIGFDPVGPNKSRQLLINLADQVPQFAVNLPHIIDFVAQDHALKQHARQRYRQYQQLGMQVSTQPLAV
ncbi:DNA polymerase III subunit chi [Shewanella intestini]|uniref:DNA polymerase III subunit chi n=1 Tax=Shewanella intestini TaxID=2017544 RepID=A0ABS5HXT9_9GAMM|nr:MULTISPECIES: DNA polymerase III subunit chi [Shewanella]MBR9726559.1 DNA polymerase III subunit chi [Shewanella intestini]MRG34875.1 DNA polymerase III subunit chi [Shewanella sp. XMDDZSB0408]